MALYKVVYEIEIDAETPKEATDKVIEIMRDSKSIPPCFEVFKNNQSLGFFDYGFKTDDDDYYQDH